MGVYLGPRPKVTNRTQPKFKLRPNGLDSDPKSKTKPIRNLATDIRGGFASGKSRVIKINNKTVEDPMDQNTLMTSQPNRP